MIILIHCRQRFKTTEPQSEDARPGLDPTYLLRNLLAFDLELSPLNLK